MDQQTKPPDPIDAPEYVIPQPINVNTLPVNVNSQSVYVNPQPLYGNPQGIYVNPQGEYMNVQPVIYSPTAGPPGIVITTQPGLLPMEVGHVSRGIKPHPGITVGT